MSGVDAITLAAVALMLIGVVAAGTALLLWWVCGKFLDD